jgi:archaeosine synthase beta-subunit
MTAALPRVYPERAAERDRWILARRDGRNPLDQSKPYAVLAEEERSESGEIVTAVTIFLTNRECPWRCVMCDLWKNTLTGTVPVGAIPAQIDYALAQLLAPNLRAGGVQESVRPRPRPSASSSNQLKTGEDEERGRGRIAKQIKLYNSGSFFDPRAIPQEDWPAIAEQVGAFERVIVECHPALIGEAAVGFRDLIGTKLEVAMGLETAHPQVLERLNKRMTLDQFAKAADFLRKNEIALRVFVLVKPPFIVDEAEALHWAERSIDFAFDCGASVVSLIPTRFGNGALEALAEQGQFTPPKLATLEAALDYGISLKRGRVFADLWDLEKFSDCATCFARRSERLHTMNLEQVVTPIVECPRCHLSPQPR